ncbi:hypothetical protein DPMN_155762 [Dreissena polymorpha]|uniref:Uncharacterized protein n=1 Tax=Dreissena polymorpha TaxID=45954 RepID=A0A9D4FRU2_DREPO|nr:hypothetical protein DPMN_155762 [Dreissena polymorpha]
MDHFDVLKGFRSGSNASSVTCRMSLIDSLNETGHPRACMETQVDDDQLGMELTPVDEAHIFPATALILRRNGFSTEENDTPINVYTKDPLVLPISILDTHSDGTGKFLLMRYLAKERMFNLTENDMPAADQIDGPKDLVARAKRSTGITLRCQICKA